jgi:hypothetical protein
MGMLLAHISPGYFAAVTATSTDWHPWQRRLLWACAIGSTIAPDTDVIYNVLFRGYVNHSTLYTHSLFVHLIPAVIGVGFWFFRMRFLAALCFVVAVGGLSHLLLDVIAHNTPLFYPFSRKMIGNAPQSIAIGGTTDYLAHPLFLLEPFLLMLATLHWTLTRDWPSQRRASLAAMVIGGWLVFTVVFLVLQPVLPGIVHGVVRRLRVRFL